MKASVILSKIEKALVKPVLNMIQGRQNSKSGLFHILFVIKTAKVLSDDVPIP